ncbi:MAG: tRNA glutamyl-Q(34) synthetase GluQRS [Zoogloeaceae bacterium]|jgi:glutamyl-Q tRNA(Asp) synthetase|nr:tRNA glutamyl-Q(34) synthetase GluQRS [Zoogloeaceae bacterium]
MICRGRFAPSPTGELHFGSLLAALASCLEARARGGEWRVRMEDVDTPRTVPGAAEAILACLEAHGFVWEGETLWQSRRREAYREALATLQSRGLAYPCACSRREIAVATDIRAIDGGLRYPGTCRHGLPPGRIARAWRLRTEDADIAFIDRIQGRICQNLARDVGDFVLWRADGQFAYQLAVVVDDAFQGITHIVRGADLLDSTSRQIYLQRCLGYDVPEYLHVPVATNAADEKLSKQTGAPALDVRQPVANLTRALAFLGQRPPQELSKASVAEVWAWALAHWKPENIPRTRRLRTNGREQPSCGATRR